MCSDHKVRLQTQDLSRFQEHTTIAMKNTHEFYFQCMPALLHHSSLSYVFIISFLAKSIRRSPWPPPAHGSPRRRRTAPPPSASCRGWTASGRWPTNDPRGLAVAAAPNAPAPARASYLRGQSPVEKRRLRECHRRSKGRCDGMDRTD